MQKTIIKRLAIYRDIKYGTEIVGDFDDIDGYIRVTEFENVLFRLIPKEKQIKNELAMIDSKIEEITAESLQKVGILNTRKQELLALPDNQHITINR